MERSTPAARTTGGCDVLPSRTALFEAVAAVADRIAAGPWSVVADEVLSTLGTAAAVDRASVLEHQATGGDRKAVVRHQWTVAVGSSSGGLEQHGIGSTLAVPVLVGGESWGSLSLDDPRPDRRWTDPEIAALRVAGSMMGSAMLRERADRALSEADARYRALVDGIPAITYIDQPDPASPTGYRPIFFSQQSETILGYSAQELEARPELWVALLHDEDRDRALAEDAAHHETGEPLDHEYRVVTKDGHVIWIRDQALMVRDDLGRPQFSHGVLLDITERVRTEAELRQTMSALEQADAQRRVLLSKLITAQEEERARIASDIHDDAVQHLAVISMRLGVVQAHLGEPQVSHDLDRLREAVREAIAGVRRFMMELRPLSLGDEGFADAIRASLRQLSHDTGMQVSFDLSLNEEPPDETAVIVYRIVQEALMNARKHASASQVRVALASRDDGIAVAVSDDGAGFDLSQVARSGHLGLVSMRERAELAGGWWTVETALGSGTTVRAWVPVAPGAPPSPTRGK